MTINDLSCDVCGRFLPGPAAGVRFAYHPGAPALRDDAGLACHACWDGITRRLGGPAPPGRCAVCAEPVTRRQSLHVRRFTEPRSWQLCLGHAVGFLNSLRTVEPKLDPATFRFPLPARAAPDRRPGRPAQASQPASEFSPAPRRSTMNS